MTAVTPEQQEVIDVSGVICKILDVMEVPPTIAASAVASVLITVLVADANLPLDSVLTWIHGMVESERKRRQSPDQVLLRLALAQEPGWPN